ncbi:hypothetical protein KQI93_14250 [Enterococcus sp. S149_ASV_20]|mgnify:CR=1 FL=1|nr:hypothetical protein [Enterococcus sp. S145_ASV_20]MBU5516358.1 hypothetical protein [Enterococcus sp. S149_ASV_20]
MKLIKLWEADLKKAYQLQTSFGPNESGFINNAYGYTFAEFLDYFVCQIKLDKSSFVT